MIGDIKNILNKIIENPDKYDFICRETYYFEDDGTKGNTSYEISYRVNNFEFSIITRIDKVHIYKDNISIAGIKYSEEDRLEISLLACKIHKLYIDKACKEFIHSLD